MWKSSTYSGRQQHLFSHWYDTDSERMVTTWIEVVTSPTWTVKNRLVKQLALRGIKHSANQIVGVGENSTEKILFLERGNANTGLQHIIYWHDAEFAKAGISKGNISKFIMQAILTGRKVGMQESIPIYKTTFNGTTHRVAVTVGNNGFLLVQIWFLNK